MQSLRWCGLSKTHPLLFESRAVGPPHSNPDTGLYEELFAFGARSFSIWSASGQFVFDSGDALELITAEAYPSNFNAANTNNTFDNRSDDKGLEPEGVVIGKA